MLKITGRQIEMARVLAGVTQKQLAEAIDMAPLTIGKLEKGESAGHASTFEKITGFFDSIGIEFTAYNGVREKPSGTVKTFEGPEEFRRFFDDIYYTARNVGGEICLFNGVPAALIKWLGQDWYLIHVERMTAIKDNFDFKVTIREGEKLFIGKSFVEYRWFPQELSHDKTIYVYGAQTAFLNFDHDAVRVWVLKEQEVADSFRVLFNIAWDKVAKKIPA